MSDRRNTCFNRRHCDGGERRINLQSGFTLIESLIVWSVFSVILFITAISMQHQFEEYDNQAFFAKLEGDLLYAQQYAIVNQTTVSVYFLPDEHEYIFSNGRNIFFRQKYSEDYFITSGTMPLHFKFLNTGKINRFGYLQIKSSLKQYKFVFQIGRGRFYVEAY
ncbi:competence type IV pilus minor pilin ComGD [Cytobacillus kochii]|uniref:competence type IV pilus minor pilin ComGD n=1 Tax=Cytobacillus kochii TaxID=859143 RepID=UPI00277EB53D|nr:competence type IV pilus minor pilin ComGD [Cytobacillus kochii]MDQ0183751.1 competence protein ComGD [Cytobacillus kochii]